MLVPMSSILDIDLDYFHLFDEHHDMFGERGPAGFGNFLYFAMRRWPDCRAHWLVRRICERGKPSWAGTGRAGKDKPET